MTEAATPTSTSTAAWSDARFEAIYREHAQAIFYLALRFLGNSSQAEDATHDVFIKAFRNLKDFRGDSNIRTWLYRITVNHCRNLNQAWQQRAIFNNTDDEVWERVGRESENPLRVLETKELGHRIQKALDELPEEYRLLLLLVADEKLSYDEVGELTDQSSDAVRGKLHRARKAFAHHFRKTN